MGLRQEKKDRTRTQLLEAALQLIHQRGFEETTIADIAAAVGVSPRTLLRYFPTKEDVLVSWVRDGLMMFVEEVRLRLSNSEKPVAAVFASARAFLSIFDENSSFFLALERAIRSNRSIVARKEHMISEIAEEVAEMLASSSKSPLSKIDALVVTGTVFVLIRTAIVSWVEGDARVSLVDLFDQAASTVKLVESVI